jgi:hypothetical protein
MERTGYGDFTPIASGVAWGTKLAWRDVCSAE